MVVKTLRDYNVLLSIYLFAYPGDEDPLVDLKWARLTGQVIKGMGFKQYAFREYNKLGHSSSDRVRTHSFDLYSFIH